MSEAEITFVPRDSKSFEFHETHLWPLLVGSTRTRDIEDAANLVVSEAERHFSHIPYVDGWKLCVSHYRILVICGGHWKVLVYKTYTRGPGRIVCEFNTLDESDRFEELKQGEKVWQRLVEELTKIPWLTPVD